MKTSHDPRVEDLVRAGRVRVALFPPMYTKNPKPGEFGGMAMDLTRALAARLRIQVRPVEFPTPGAVFEGLNAGACDIAFLVVNEPRAAVLDFTPPYAQRLHIYVAVRLEKLTYQGCGAADRQRSLRERSVRRQLPPAELADLAEFLDRDRNVER